VRGQCISAKAAYKYLLYFSRENPVGISPSWVQDLDQNFSKSIPDLRYNSVAEYLPSIMPGLDLIPSTTKTKKSLFQRTTKHCQTEFLAQIRKLYYITYLEIAVHINTLKTSRCQARCGSTNL
jgi:hypothetical protein